MNLDHLPEIVGEFYTTQSAINEIKSSQSKHLFELFREKYRISIASPAQKYLTIVENASKSIGQMKLSDTDREILALTLMLQEDGEVKLLSDDYGLRNVAHELDINSEGVKTIGGNQLRRYNYICSACQTSFSERFEECDTCGNTKFIRRRRKN